MNFASPSNPDVQFIPCSPSAVYSTTVDMFVLTWPHFFSQMLSAMYVIVQRTDEKGIKYYQFEFTATSGFTRHQLAVRNSHDSLEPH